MLVGFLQNLLECPSLPQLKHCRIPDENMPTGLTVFHRRIELGILRARIIILTGINELYLVILSNPSFETFNSNRTNVRIKSGNFS